MQPQRSPIDRPLLATCLALLCSATLSAAEIPAELKIAPGPYKADRESFKQYQTPEWFRDAKFGIWSHWGPQCVPEDGDWYARRLYLSGTPKPDKGVGTFVPGSKPNRGNELHTQRYGHPSEVGYKDIIPLWKAEKWDPEKLMQLYVDAGAHYFVSMAVHHDNYDLWDSRFQPRWNATKVGPMRDVVGDWQRAAKKFGLPFGVSEHLGASFTWFQVNKSSDISGPKAGVPYDGNDPRYEDLYHPRSESGDHEWLTNNPKFLATWYRRIQDLVDKYNPELLYSDSKLPFGAIGEQLVAHYYNANMARNGGRLTAVYNCKEEPKPNGWVRDIERGVALGISEEPWQTDTSIGDWYYRKGETYKTATQIIQMLADIVSKNGNLLINVVQKADGEITPEARQTLTEMAAWMKINGECIFATRPWFVFGDGPSATEVPEAGRFGGAKDVRSKPYTAEDVRYTRSKDGSRLYAIVLAWPKGKAAFPSLRVRGKQPGAEVRLLGHAAPLPYSVDAHGALVVEFPKEAPCSHAYGVRFSGFDFEHPQPRPVAAPVSKR